MELFRPLKGFAAIYIIFITVLTNIFMGALVYLVNSYVIVSLLKVALMVINGYFIYYLAVSLSVRYIISDNYLVISSLWGLRNIRINIENIEGYVMLDGSIRGVKLSGIGNDKFAFGRSIIDKIGTTHMFVTSNKKIFYLKTPGISYAVSPKEHDKFQKILIQKDLRNEISPYKLSRNVNLYKEKSFLIPFILVTLIIFMITLNPFILYLKNMLPTKMPLHFDAMFQPLVFGTGKQFAFKQMTYGVLNMIILLCMYYASYFCAKYDRKSAYKYIYVSLITSSVFLIMQIRILLFFS